MIESGNRGASNERGDFRARFTPEQLVHAKSVILSFAGESSSLDHLGTVGFIGVEAGKGIPDGQDKVLLPHELSSEAYKDAQIVFQDLKSNPVINEGIETGYVSPDIMESMEHQITERVIETEAAQKSEEVAASEKEYERTGGLMVTGWGPFPMPGEKKRLAESREYAKAAMAIAQGEPVTEEQLRILRKK
jgi:hypothetical protein